MSNEERSCEQVIDSHMEDRNVYLENLNDIICDNDSEPEDVENALRELSEFPAGIESFKVIKIILSGGGPADWIEAKLDDDGYVRSMTYHWQDWGDHAQRKIKENSYLWEFAIQIVDTY